MPPEPVAAAIPHQGLLALFLRFLRFGFFAWGGPVAQIALIREELVEREQWVSRERFNQVLGVYQALPGPEAHELCVYFGMISRGRVGGLLAGLGFMLPGFLLMFLLSFLYVRFGMELGKYALVFSAVQAAVLALICRAVVKIGQHAVTGPLTAIVAGLAALGQLVGVNFVLALLMGGAAIAFGKRGRQRAAIAVLALFVVGSAALFFSGQLVASPLLTSVAGSVTTAAPTTQPTWPTFLISGLRAGLLTFGGAYTAIPFVQRDAVLIGGWMTDAQFLDGLALGGVLPAPLIIFTTFVGFLGGGGWGAILMTLGVFLPAFSFTLVGHALFERLLERKGVHAFLEGVTAAVVGIIGATALVLVRAALTGPVAVGVFLVALVILFRSKSVWTVPAVILGGAAVGGVALALA